MNAATTASTKKNPTAGRPLAALGEARNAEALVAAIIAETGTDGFVVKQARRIEGQIPSETLHSFAAALRQRLGVEHLSAISCVDWIAEAEFELVYHFWSYRDSCLISVRTRIDREPASMATITDLWLPASFFERDIHEFYGVVFQGNTDLERYILTDWKGPPPMRKDFSSRDFAHEHFTFKDYEPTWDEMIEGGYHGSNGTAEGSHE
jgi:NADH-quinone oxidoreductase subunit C